MKRTFVPLQQEYSTCHNIVDSVALCGQGPNPDFVIMWCFSSHFAHWPALSLVLLHLSTVSSTPIIISDVSQVRQNTSQIALSGDSAPTNASNDYVIYRVPGTPTILGLHSFGAAIDLIKLERAFDVATGVVMQIAETEGSSPIKSGMWTYIHRFRDGDSITFSVHDFREAGRALIYDRLLDVIEGLFFFMHERQSYKEVYFEIEVDGVGAVGSGRLSFNHGPPFPPKAVGAMLNGVALNKTVSIVS